MDNQKLWEKAARQFDTIHSAVRDERQQCVNDRRFYSIAGAQWEGKLGEQFENKPKMEVNKIHLSVIRIINEYRNNRITVNYESDSDPDLAELCDGLYRQDENHSSAQEAYDNAFEEAVGGGMGAWRLTTEYKDDTDEDDDEQRVMIEPIYDADTSVFFDLDAKRQDKRDANYCFVITSMSRQAFIDEYDEDPASWPKDTYQCHFDWSTPDVVYVAEYYVIEKKKASVHVWQTLEGDELRLSDDELERRREELLALGSRELRIKKVVKQRVRKYIMSGSSILDDCGYIAGDQIPIIPVYGKRWYVDNIERCMGHVRLAKDAQRLKNMQLSKLAEISALSTTEKPIFMPEQVVGHQTMWREDNIKNYPYLLLNPITDVGGNPVPSGPIAFTKPPTIPSALAALLQVTEQDMSDILGNNQNGEQMAGNISTQTAELIQTKLDMQTYIYMSNMAKAIKRSGQVYLSIARDVYVEEGREVTLRNNAGEVSKAELMQPNVNGDGAIVTLNDLSRAKFDVVTDVGPSSSTKKSATVRQLMGMMQVATDPTTMQVLSSMIMLNMEGEGVAEVRDYFRQNLISMGVVKPTELEAKELAEAAESAEPSANDRYLEALAVNEQAKAVEAQSDTLLNSARTDETRAKTLETMANIEQAKIDQLLQIIEKLGPNVDPSKLAGPPVGS